MKLSSATPHLETLSVTLHLSLFYKVYKKKKKILNKNITSSLQFITMEYKEIRVERYTKMKCKFENKCTLKNPSPSIKAQIIFKNDLELFSRQCKKCRVFKQELKAQTNY